MDGLNEIITELHAIREELTRIADLEEQRQKKRKANKAQAEEQTQNAGIISGTLAAAFSNNDSVKRSELYNIEIETAKTENRPPVRKHLFFSYVLSSGYYLKKTNHGYFFCK